MKAPKTHCVRGHDISVVGRDPKQRCRECHRQDDRARAVRVALRDLVARLDSIEATVAALAETVAEQSSVALNGLGQVVAATRRHDRQVRDLANELEQARHA